MTATVTALAPVVTEEFANPTGSRVEGERIARAARNAAIQETYRQAHKEGTRKGRSIARKALFADEHGLSAEDIVAMALAGT